MICTFITGKPSDTLQKDTPNLCIPIVYGSNCQGYEFDCGNILSQIWKVENFELEYLCGSVKKPITFEFKTGEAYELLGINLSGKLKIHAFQTGTISIDDLSGTLIRNQPIQGFCTMLPSKRISRFLLISCNRKFVTDQENFITGDRKSFELFPEMTDLVDRVLYTSYKTIQPFHEKQVSDLFSICQKLISRTASLLPIGSQDVSVIQMAKDIIDVNIERNHTLSQLAFKLAIHPRKLNSGFYQLYEKSIYDYVREKRLIAAHEKIETSFTQLKVIGRAAGYKSYSNFSIAFHKQFGYTPASLRKNKTGRTHN